jgi:hypothetical protein
VSIAPSTGFIGTRLANLGEVTNKGVELSVFGSPVQTRNFGWDARVNLATNANKLVSFGIVGKTVDTPTGQPFATVQQHRPGYPLGGYWVISPATGADGRPVLTNRGLAAQFPVGWTRARRYSVSPRRRTRSDLELLTVFRRHSAIYGFWSTTRAANMIFNQRSGTLRVRVRRTTTAGDEQTRPRGSRRRWLRHRSCLKRARGVSQRSRHPSGLQ